MTDVADDIKDYVINGHNPNSDDASLMKDGSSEGAFLTMIMRFY